MESYLSAPPRAGSFLQLRLGKTFRSIVEIAGGSCRDSRYLADSGYHAMGTDFEGKTIEYLRKERFPNDRLKYKVENAWALDFEDKSIDLVFHNGFFGLFRDDEQIYRLLREQCRVASRYAVFFVHNKLNHRLMRDFLKRSANDRLYDIRFFSPDEVRSLVRRSGVQCRSVKLEKLGGWPDILYLRRVKGVPNPFASLAVRWVPRLYKIMRWSDTERIACTMELRR